jgi:hypothetical protein
MRVGEVSKRTSPVERRETVNRNGAVWTVKVRSEDALERVRLLGKAPLPCESSSKTSCSAGRGMTSRGTSHRGWSASVMRTWSRLSVSRLPPP